MEIPFGRYLLVERLGTGSLTEAYRAKSFGVEGFEKAIVVKRVLPHLAALPGLIDAFVDRAKASLALSHANVVQVIDLGRASAELPFERGSAEHTFIATELVSGVDLGTLLGHARQKRVSVPIGLALFVAAEIAKALEHAHKRRSGAVIHGPVTPQSVLVSWEGEVKVSDFGIHRALSRVRYEPDEAKTLPYTSPEELRGEEPQAHSDVFALGALLFELLTGVSAFGRSDREATRRAIASGPRPIPSASRSDLPKEIDVLVARMFAVEPGERFGDAAGVHEELVALGYSLGVRPSHDEVALFASRLARHEEPPTREAEEVELSLGDATPAPASVARAERREATLFCAAGLDATSHRATFSERIERAGGIVVAGDGAELRAVFGLVDPDGRDTESAVVAGLALVAEAPDASIGIDLGRVTADERGGLVVDAELGASFSVVARLAASEKGKVRLTRAAAKAVERDVELERLPTDDCAIAKSVRPPRPSTARFVGRRAELEALGAAFSRATRGEPGVSFVTGDRGVGKTRLVAELERRLAKQPAGVLVAHVASARDLGGSGAPLSTIGPLVRALFGATRGAVTRERADDLVRELRALGLDEVETSAICRLASGEASAPSVEETARALARVVAKMSRDRALVLCVDEVEHLDEASAKVLAALFEDAEKRRLHLVLAGRSLREPLLGLSRPIPLGPLADEDVAVLAASLLGARVLPPELVAHLGARGEHNPLFVELLVKELTDGALVTVRQGVAHVDLERAGVPRTLRALVEGRLTRLADEGSPALREIVRALAILGPGASVAELAGLVGEPSERVEAAMKMLEERGLSAEGRLEGVLGEVVLETIPEDERRRAHLRAAEIVEGLGEPTGPRLDRVGNHLAAAGEGARAAAKLAVAATLHGGTARGARPDLAARSVARALSCAPLGEVEPAEIARWLALLADAVARSRVRVGFADLGAQVLERIDGADDVSLAVRARLDVARIAAAESSFEEAEVVLAQARERATTPELTAAALAAEVQLAERSGDVRRGREAARALVGLGPIRDARVLLDVATLFASALDLDEARAAVDMAYELSLSDTAALRANVEACRARVLLAEGDAAGAQRSSLLGADLADAHELYYDVAAAKLLLAEAHLARERPERAYSAFVEALEAAETGGHERLGVLARAGLAFLDGLRDDVERSDRASSPLSRMAKEADARGFAADALTIRIWAGKLSAARSRGADARTELEEALAKARELGHGALAREAERVLGALASAQLGPDAPIP